MTGIEPVVEIVLSDALPHQVRSVAFGQFTAPLTDGASTVELWTPVE